jgi:hypothetical protein
MVQFLARNFSLQNVLPALGVYPASYSVGMREALSFGGRGQRDNSLCLMAWLRMSGVTHLLPVCHYGIHRGNFTLFTSVHIVGYIKSIPKK